MLIFIAGRDKTFATLHQHYYFCMMRQCIQMHIKYCEPCQMNNHKKLDNCPTEMQPVRVPQHTWKQIGNTVSYLLMHTCVSMAQCKTLLII